MHKLVRSFTALLLGALLVPNAFAADANDKQIATINGDPVMASELLTFAKVRSPNADISNPEIRNQMIQAYVGRELLYQEAIAQKIDQQEIVKIAVENQRHEVISQALVARIMRDTPITDEQVRKFYDEQAAANKADTSTSTPLPEFEQVSGKIKQLLMERSVAMYVQSLQKKAKIENTN